MTGVQTCAFRSCMHIFFGNAFSCLGNRKGLCRVREMVFCSRTEEAQFMADEFRNHGYRAVSLGGANSPDEREDAISKLMMEESPEALDYIFTVDIFNEGVDIPAVNQIIMLRPTESPIVFVQQLGRGLRKAYEKIGRAHV